MWYKLEKIAWIDCIFVPMESASSTVIEVIFRSWKENEAENQHWLSHCLEHMFFKWWKKFVGEWALFRALDLIWAKRNWSTWLYKCHYYIQTAPEFINKAIEILWDMVWSDKFKDEDLETEKHVIIEELRMNEINPNRSTRDNWFNWYVGDNSFGRNTIWTEESVLSFTTQDLIDYKNSLYTKDNMVIILAWNWVDDDVIKNNIEINFWWLKEKRALDYPLFPNVLPNEHKSIIDKWLKQNQLIISAPWVDWNNNLKYAANVCASMLWWCRSSRLQQNIRTKEWLCYGIYADHDSWPDFWYFYVNAWINKKNFDYWLSKIMETIEDFVKQDITQEELDLHISYIIWRLKVNQDMIQQKAYSIWINYLFYKQLKTIDELVNHYKQVTIEDINKVKWLLSSENLYTFYVR